MMPGDAFGLLFALPEILGLLIGLIVWMFTDGLPWTLGLIAVSWIWGRIQERSEDARMGPTAHDRERWEAIRERNKKMM